MNMEISTRHRDFFQDQLQKYYLQMLLKDLSIFILKFCHTDTITQVFDLDIFDKKAEIYDLKKTLEITQKAIEILHEKGWKTFLCYGNTCLAIYDQVVPESILGQMEVPPVL